jgi:DNA-binding response OmpR family regulator
MNVLIVEDDIGVARFLKQAISEAGYTPIMAADGQEAMECLESTPISLVLLDIMIPKISGLEVCRRMRADNYQMPVLMITARDGVEDKVEGLDAGADDYLVKPFQLVELLARVRALMRRGNAPPPMLQIEDLSLDPTTRRAMRGTKSISLSSTEYALLELLMRSAGRVVSRATILEHVWQYDFEGNDNVLDVYISYLRGKIDRGQVTPLIYTARGIGFRIGPERAK